MKVLHVTHSDSPGGAARAAYRLYRAERELGTDSYMLVNIKNRTENEILTNFNSLTKFSSRLKASVARRITKLLAPDPYLPYSANLFSSHHVQFINSSDFDLVHLHWINNNMLSMKDISRIQKPIVWTFHDMWPICGIEHYCFHDRWKEGYRPDNRPGNETGFDLSLWQWNQKSKHLKKPFQITCPSSWLSNCVKQSALMKDWPVQTIPNGLDTTFWTHADNTHIRDTLGLPKDKQIILFGANQFKQGHIKGFDLLKEALSLLPKEKMSDVELLVFGADSGGSSENEGYPINYLGYVDDPSHLRDLYRSADVMLVPSRMESFGQTASEAHACGIPVVAFDASGTADIVDHMKTGYLARAFDVNDFCAGILWVLENDQRRKQLGLEARRKAENCFDHLLVAKEHIKTYKKVLNV